jgi:Fe-S cluster assembly protein SufD
MDNAIVTHYKLQQESIEAYHIGSVYGQLGKSAQLYSHSFSFGGRLVRSDTLVSFEEQGGHCGMNGLYLVGDHQHVDHHTSANHKVPHCTSDEFYKGILNGNSRAVFNGKVVVAKDAQKTNASQQNKNLLLSKQAEVDTKPQLEIYADDVKCAHGATVGQLDEDALFYLQSRGLNPEQAKEFLLTAFVADRIEQVKFKGLKQRLTELMHAQRSV